MEPHGEVSVPGDGDGQYGGNLGSLLVPRPTPSTGILLGHLLYHPNK